MPRTSRARFVPEPPIYAFRVRILGGFYAPPGSQLIWREIALAANQTLDNLGKRSRWRSTSMIRICGLLPEWQAVGHRQRIHLISRAG